MRLTFDWALAVQIIAWCMNRINVLVMNHGVKSRFAEDLKSANVQNGSFMITITMYSQTGCCKCHLGYIACTVYIPAKSAMFLIHSKGSSPKTFPFD